MSTSPSLLLVDMAALLFRSHYAFIKRPLMRSDGLVTSALYGTTNALLTILNRYQPDYVVAALEGKGKTFRHDMYPEYKAHRPPCPPELVTQLEMQDQMCAALGIQAVGRPSYEADDIIGSYARLGQKEGYKVTILSGDKDFMQLLDANTEMLIPQKFGDYESLTGDKVKDKIGVRHDQVIDYLALLGDASDNVPGAPGVGKVGAAALLEQYDNLDCIIKDADNIKKRGVGAKIKQNVEQIYLSRELVTIHTELASLPALPEVSFQGLQADKVSPFLDDMEFPKLQARLKSMNLKGGGTVAKEVFVSPQEKFKRKDSTLMLKSELVSELDSLPEGEALWLNAQWQGDALQAIAVSAKEGECLYIPCLADDLQGAGFHDLGEFLLLLTTKPLAGHNLKPLARLVAQYSSDYRLLYDSYLEACLLMPGKVDHSLDKLCAQEFGLALSELGKTGNKKNTFANLDSSMALTYACERADLSRRLSEVHRARLKNQGMEEVYLGLEMELLPVVAQMEKWGVGLDCEHLLKLSGEASTELEQLTQEIYSLSGEEFNINSTQQLGEVLFEKMKIQNELGLKKVKKTKTGYSTDSKVLESISGHPIGAALQRYRTLSKLRSTYLDALPGEVNEGTGRVHTTYLQSGTATGRLSSQKPNLQNIPMRTHDGARIREAFIPAPGNVMISADYSQIELRILAHYCKDDSMSEILSRGGDIHQATAAKVFGIDEEDVSREQRSSAKAVNFGLLYGMGPKLLSTQTGMAFGDAQKFIKSYFESFPGIRNFMQELIAETRKTGYALTLSGRRRALPDLESTNGMLRSAAENMALNTPIQGTAADVIKWAMLKLEAEIERQGWPLKMLLQVHDELVFECPEGKAEEMRARIIEIMEDRSDLPQVFEIPLKVEAGMGNNWLEAH
ncbi:MAG: DNA polymerase I [Planctomycetes bacterium]|nr:DNA polymerase I [Planctomycetota bacterium]